MKALLSLSDVMARLAVARKAVLLLVARGQLVGLKVGRQWRFEPADVDDYIARQKAAAIARTPTAAVAVRPPPTSSGGVGWKGASRYYQ